MAPSPLDLRYNATVKRVRQRVVDYLVGQFTADQFRDADLARFVALAVPVVLAGQRQVGALTDAYLAQVLGTRPAGIPTDYPRGVNPGEVYARPYVTVRTALSVGKSLTQAKSEGVERLKDIAATDMQLAKTHTARRSFQQNHVERYRRTLTGSVNCALCTIASTQIYHSEDLLPIHPGCDCGVSPVFGDFDQTAELDAAHESIASRFGEDAVSSGGRNPLDYRKAILVREHGEIGSVLTLREHQFTSASQLPRT